MDTTNFTLFFAASWVLILTPGPDIIYVMSRGISQGKKAGILSAAGVTVGILVHTVFAALGLAVILRTSSLAFLVVKLAGAVYLIYLGYASIKQPPEQIFNLKRPASAWRTIFMQGLLTNVLNPKVALFFLAFLPQFVNPAADNIPYQMALLGLVYALSGLLFLLLLGYWSGRIGSWLSTRQGLSRWVHRFTGSLLVILGLRLAFMENR